MKQEPDIAYIGDITNEGEARATIQGAFAKRIVLARMTANDTINAIQNLVDMGVQPFLLAASLTAIINQRLIRKLCPVCKEGYKVSDAIQRELGFKLPENAMFYKAKGCQQCGNTGFSGVAALFELYRPSEELKQNDSGKRVNPEHKKRGIQRGARLFEKGWRCKNIDGACYT